MFGCGMAVSDSCARCVCMCVCVFKELIYVGVCIFRKIGRRFEVYGWLWVKWKDFWQTTFISMDVRKRENKKSVLAWEWKIYLLHFLYAFSSVSRSAMWMQILFYEVFRFICLWVKKDCIFLHTYTLPHIRTCGSVYVWLCLNIYSCRCVYIYLFIFRRR